MNAIDEALVSLLRLTKLINKDMDECKEKKRNE
jgi:hypothetical protein